MVERFLLKNPPGYGRGRAKSHGKLSGAISGVVATQNKVVSERDRRSSTATQKLKEETNETARCGVKPIFFGMRVIQEV